MRRARPGCHHRCRSSDRRRACRRIPRGRLSDYWRRLRAGRGSGEAGCGRRGGITAFGANLTRSPYVNAAGVLRAVRSPIRPSLPELSSQPDGNHADGGCLPRGVGERKGSISTSPRCTRSSARRSRLVCVVEGGVVQLTKSLAVAWARGRPRQRDRARLDRTPMTIPLAPTPRATARLPTARRWAAGARPLISSGRRCSSPAMAPLHHRRRLVVDGGYSVK